MGILDELLGAQQAEPPAPPRPMLASALSEATLDQVRWPKLVSFKVDGYRCQLRDGRAYARSGKLHPCKAVQEWAKQFSLPLDGELIVPGKAFNEAGGLLRRADYSGPFEFLVFDLVQDGLKAQERYQFLQHAQVYWPSNTKLLTQWWTESKEGLLSLENLALQYDFEGLVLREPGALYKHGRGTLKDQIMLKLKRFKTAEAKVWAVEPRKFNSNPAQLTPLGYTERSTEASGMLETNVLGKLHCIGLNGPFAGAKFSIGNFDGLTDQDKIQLLAEPPLNRVLTYKYFPEGVLNRPRHPVFLGWRPEWDLPCEEPCEEEVSNAD